MFTKVSVKLFLIPVLFLQLMLTEEVWSLETGAAPETGAVLLVTTAPTTGTTAAQQPWQIQWRDWIRRQPHQHQRTVATRQPLLQDLAIGKTPSQLLLFNPYRQIQITWIESIQTTWFKSFINVYLFTCLIKPTQWYINRLVKLDYYSHSNSGSSGMLVLQQHQVKN